MSSIPSTGVSARKRWSVYRAVPWKVPGGEEGCGGASAWPDRARPWVIFGGGFSVEGCPVTVPFGPRVRVDAWHQCTLVKGVGLFHTDADMRTKTVDDAGDPASLQMLLGMQPREPVAIRRCDGGSKRRVRCRVSPRATGRKGRGDAERAACRGSGTVGGGAAQGRGVAGEGAGRPRRRGGPSARGARRATGATEANPVADPKRTLEDPDKA